MLVEPDVWLSAQRLLEANAHRGEKTRVHPHYLRSTIYCSDCGGRLVYSEAKGNGGTYIYYLCVKRKTKTNNCQRPAMRLEYVEAGIADFYAGFQVQPEYAEQIRAGVRRELASQQDHARASLVRAKKRRERIDNERQLLLRSHYDGTIPKDLVASEMMRFTRELAETETEIAAAQTTTRELETTLDQALTAATHCERAYLTAPEHIRRQINQGFFERLLIGEDGSVERAELTEPFAALLADGRTICRTDTPTTPVDTQTVPNEEDEQTTRNRPMGVFQAIYGDPGADTES